MACSCKSPNRYIVTRPDGTQAQYRTEAEAAADVRRNGGSYAVLSAAA